MVSFAWIFFRVNVVEDAIEIIRRIFTSSGKLFVDISTFIYGGLALIVLISKDFIDEYIPSKFNFLNNSNLFVRCMASVLLISFILMFGVLNGGQFIYFQF